MLKALFGKLSVSTLLGGLVSQLTSVVRYEVELAKREVQRKLKAIVAGLGLLVVAAAILFFALGLLILAAVVALSQVWPMWLAALVVAGVLAIVASVFVGVGVSRIKKNSDLRPERMVSAYRRFAGDPA